MHIYQIRNLLDDKRYIGQTINSWQYRWRKHREKLLRNEHENEYLQNSWNKYGVDAFICEPIIECSTIEELNESEIAHIQFYDTLNRKRGYNLKEGGTNGRHTSETRALMSIQKTGSTHTEETRLGMAERMKGNTIMLGRKHKLETRAKMSSTPRKPYKPRKPTSTEARRNMSASRLGKKRGPYKLNKVKNNV